MNIEPVGIAEIAQHAAVAEITVRKWIERHPDFPAPRWRVSGRGAYDWQEIDAWLTRTGRVNRNLRRIAETMRAAAPALLSTLAAVEQLADAMDMPAGPERPYAVRPAIAAVEAAVADLDRHSLPYLHAGLANDARHALTMAAHERHEGTARYSRGEVRRIAESMRNIIRQGGTPTTTTDADRIATRITRHQEDTMTTYTVEIQASNADGTIWQALAPAETVESDGTADEVALDTAQHQNIAEGGNWRVCVWRGADADTGIEPDCILVANEG